MREQPSGKSTTQEDQIMRLTGKAQLLVSRSPCVGEAEGPLWGEETQVVGAEEAQAKVS